MKNVNNNYFLIILLLSIIVIFLFKKLLNTDELIYNFYSEKLAQEQIEKILTTQQKWEWTTYAIIPLVILIRSSLVAMC